MRPSVIALLSVSWDGRVVDSKVPGEMGEWRRFCGEVLERADAFAFDHAGAREGMALASGHGKLRALVCADGGLAACTALLATGPASAGGTVVYAPQESALAGGEELEGGDLRLSGGGALDPVEMLESLGSEYGVRRVVCVGGGDLAGRLVRAGCVGELWLNYRPQIMANKTGETASGAGVGFLPESVKASLLSMKQVEGECFTRWGLKFGREFFRKG